MSGYIVKIGKKGELYPPKKLRIEAGLLPGSELIAEVRGDEISLRKKKGIGDLLEKKGLTTLGVDEVIRERKELEKELFER